MTNLTRSLAAIAFAFTLAAQTTVEPAKVPPAIALKPGQITLLKLQAAGAQIYECDGIKTWNLVGPSANLFDANRNVVGTHFAGPSWQLADLSGAVGSKIAASPSPDGVPWLLLSVASHFGKPGLLDTVATIQRVNTAGGLAPNDHCDAGNKGQRISVPYTAEYYFSK